MSPNRREMQFGVFVLGTGNHSPFPRDRDSLGRMTRWLVAMALLTGCATQQAAQPDCKMKWTGQPPVQVDSCTGRGEDLTPGWHWYDYVFGIPLGIVGFYDPASDAN